MTFYWRRITWIVDDVTVQGGWIDSSMKDEAVEEVLRDIRAHLRPDLRDTLTITPRDEEE